MIAIWMFVGGTLGRIIHCYISKKSFIFINYGCFVGLVLGFYKGCYGKSMYEIFHNIYLK